MIDSTLRFRACPRKKGQEVKVKVLGIDDRGKVKLSMKMVDQETGQEISSDA